MTVRSDHTLTAQFDGYVSHPAIVATWKITGNRLEVNKQVPQFFPTLLVARYKNSIVLMPEAKQDMSKPLNYSPALCFWHYTTDKQGIVLPHDAADTMKRWKYSLRTTP